MVFVQPVVCTSISRALRRLQAEVSRVVTCRYTGRRRIKKLLKGAERLEFLNFWVVETLSFLARFGPLGPKLELLVATTAFAEVNFVEKVPGHARRACVARFARRFVQKCELFLDCSDFVSE